MCFPALPSGTHGVTIPARSLRAAMRAMMRALRVAGGRCESALDLARRGGLAQAQARWDRLPFVAFSWVRGLESRLKWVLCNLCNLRPSVRPQRKISLPTIRFFIFIFFASS